MVGAPFLSLAERITVMSCMHYNTLRYHRRIGKLSELLGGECTKCGAQDGLHFHHMVRADKSFDLTTEFDRPWSQLLEELKKCELRCEPCHKMEHGAQHGIGMYVHHKCRCDICRTAWNAKCREYKKTYRAKLARTTIS